jgi:hypothetical protein
MPIANFALQDTLVTYREISLADSEERAVENGEALGRGLQVAGQRRDLVDVVRDHLSRNARCNGGEAGEDEGLEAHLGGERGELGRVVEMA